MIIIIVFTVWILYYSGIRMHMKCMLSPITQLRTYRLEKLTKLLNTVATYDVLTLSQLDGMDTYSLRFNVLITTLKKKPYDILEHRKADFDIDYDDFQRQLTDLNVSRQTCNVKSSGSLYIVCSDLAILR